MFFCLAATTSRPRNRATSTLDLNVLPHGLQKVRSWREPCARGGPKRTLHSSTIDAVPPQPSRYELRRPSSCKLSADVEPVTFALRCCSDLAVCCLSLLPGSDSTNEWQPAWRCVRLQPGVSHILGLSDASEAPVPGSSAAATLRGVKRTTEKRARQTADDPGGS